MLVLLPNFRSNNPVSRRRSCGLTVDCPDTATVSEPLLSLAADTWCVRVHQARQLSSSCISEPGADILSTLSRNGDEELTGSQYNPHFEVCEPDLMWCHKCTFYKHIISGAWVASRSQSHNAWATEAVSNTCRSS